MATPAGVHLGASQREVHCDDSSLAFSAAKSLLAALRTPLSLKWEVQLHDGTTAAISAEISNEVTAWPPRNVKVVIGDFSEGFDLTVSSAISAEQLAELIHAGVDGAQFEESLGMPVEAYPLSVAVAELQLVDQDPSRCIYQPRCVRQWHGSTCGHHALFNISCLLEHQPGSLQDGHRFWQTTLDNIQSLVRDGENSGRWQRSRVTGGMVDEVHLQHLIESNRTLSGRVTIVQTCEALCEQLQDPKSTLRRVVDDVCTGRSVAHGFLLPSTEHWYAAVAVAASSDEGGPRLMFFDSHNLPLARLRTAEQVDVLVEDALESGRARHCAKLREKADWMHRPEGHLDRSFEEGIEEWWKGSLKTALFWRAQPKRVRQELGRHRLEYVRACLAALTAALRPCSLETP